MVCRTYPSYLVLQNFQQKEHQPTTPKERTCSSKEPPRHEPFVNHFAADRVSSLLFLLFDVFFSQPTSAHQKFFCLTFIAGISEYVQMVSMRCCKVYLRYLELSVSDSQKSRVYLPILTSDS